MTNKPVNKPVSASAEWWEALEAHLEAQGVKNRSEYIRQAVENRVADEGGAINVNTRQWGIRRDYEMNAIAKYNQSTILSLLLEVGVQPEEITDNTYVYVAEDLRITVMEKRDRNAEPDDLLYGGEYITATYTVEEAREDLADLMDELADLPEFDPEKWGGLSDDELLAYGSADALYNAANEIYPVDRESVIRWWNQHAG